jgi:hypothetical protein
MDKDQSEWQDGDEFELHGVPVKASGSSYNLLSHRQMDTLHCRQHALGSAVQSNRSVYPMPHNLSRSLATPPHPGTAHTLPIRSAVSAASR